MEGCLFCKIIKGEIPSFKIYEDENTFAFLDISGDYYGHTLVVPKTHCENFLDASGELLSCVTLTAQKIANHYIDDCGYNGVNIINNSNECAGQSVMHFHIHVIPRKNDDGINIYSPTQKAYYDLKAASERLKF
mgnify:CR=1 FL=1